MFRINYKKMEYNTQYKCSGRTAAQTDGSVNKRYYHEFEGRTWCRGNKFGVIIDSIDGNAVSGLAFSTKFWTADELYSALSEVFSEISRTNEIYVPEPEYDEAEILAMTEPWLAFENSNHGGYAW